MTEVFEEIKKQTGSLPTKLVEYSEKMSSDVTPISSEASSSEEADSQPMLRSHDIFQAIRPENGKKRVRVKP